MSNALIGLRTLQGILCPGDFRCNEKQAYHWLCSYGWEAEVFSNLLEYLRVPGDCLGKVAHSDDHSSYKEFAKVCGSVTDKEWQLYRRTQEEAWQDPKALLTCLDQLIARLKSNPPDPGKLELDDKEELLYFLIFFEDLREMAKWAVDNQITMVRIEWNG